MQRKYINCYKNFAFGGKLMYKFERYRQLELADFNQSVGLKTNPGNRWVKKSETIPWDAIERKYAKLFPSKTGMPRIEKMSFDAYNESDVLIAAVERYMERTGHYPEHILADKIYRNRNNLAYCKEHRIRLLGPPLERPKKKCRN